MNANFPSKCDNQDYVVAFGSETGCERQEKLYNKWREDFGFVG